MGLRKPLPKNVRKKKPPRLPGPNQGSLSVHGIVHGEHRFVPADRVFERMGSGVVHIRRG